MERRPDAKPVSVSPKRALCFGGRPPAASLVVKNVTQSTVLFKARPRPARSGGAGAPTRERRAAARSRCRLRHLRSLRRARRFHQRRWMPSGPAS